MNFTSVTLFTASRRPRRWTRCPSGPFGKEKSFLWLFLVLSCLRCPDTSLATSPSHEQVCDSVLTGEVGVKYSLRLTEPVSSRFHTFHCDITFEPPTINALERQSFHQSSPSYHPSSMSHLSLPPSSSSSRGKVAFSESGVTQSPVTSSLREPQSSEPLTSGKKKAQATTDTINGAKDNSLMMGDVIELTFLSFQVGSFELTKDHQGSCQKGHLTIREKNWAQSKEQLANSFASPSNFDGQLGDVIQGGRFCGQMMSRKAIYYSNANSTVTLSVYLPPANPFFGHSSHFSLFLTYKFISSKSPPLTTTNNLSYNWPSPGNLNEIRSGPFTSSMPSSQGFLRETAEAQRKNFTPLHHQNSSPSVSSSTSNSHETTGLSDSDYLSSRQLQVQLGTKMNSQKAHLHLHPWNSNSNCDVIFDSCVPPQICKIQSPNFPGFYLRNVTCNYWFKESNVPSGYKGYYIIQSKPNEHSISLSPMASSLSVPQPVTASTPIPSDSLPNSPSNASLLFDFTFCSAFDSITIFSGRDPSNSSAVVTRFCSNGNLPLLITPMAISSSSGTSVRDGMVIVFKSASNSLLFDSRFELLVQTVLIPLSSGEDEFTSTSKQQSSLSPTKFTSDGKVSTWFKSPGSPCDVTIDVEQMSTISNLGDLTGSPVRRWGSLALSLVDYHLPRTLNSSCTLKFVSNEPTDRVWLTLTSSDSSGLVTADHPVLGEQCSSSNYFEMFGQVSQIRVPTDHWNGSKCWSPGHLIGFSRDGVTRNSGNHFTLEEAVHSAGDGPLLPATAKLCQVRNSPVNNLVLLKSPTIASQLLAAGAVTPSPLSSKMPSECPKGEGFLSHGPLLHFKSTFKSTPALFAPFLLTRSGEVMSDAQLEAKLHPVNGFTLDYEFIDMKEFGDAVANTLCDRIINPVAGKSSQVYKGVVSSTRNTFLFARGSGRRDLSCSYELTNDQLYKVKIHFTSIRLSSNSCTTTIDPATKMYTCSNVTSSPVTTSASSASSLSPELQGASEGSTLSTLRVFDSINNEASTASKGEASVTLGTTDRIQIGCLCSSPPQASTASTVKHATYTGPQHSSLATGRVDSDLIESSLLRDSVTFEAVGRKIVINLTIVNMGREDDFAKFGFDARYEYIPQPLSNIAPQGHEDAETASIDHNQHSFGSSDSICPSFVSIGKKHTSQGQLMIYKSPRQGAPSPSSLEEGGNHPGHHGNASPLDMGLEPIQGHPEHIRCRYLLKRSAPNSHFFLQFPSSRISDSSRRMIDCDLVRVYTLTRKTATSSTDQQVLTWLPLKSFCLDDWHEEDKLEGTANPSLVVKSKNHGKSSPGENEAAAGEVEVMLEVIVRTNKSTSRAEERGPRLAATWLQVTSEAKCPSYCPEAAGCLSPDLWCDGSLHCPSGLDEANCDHLQMQTIITSQNEATVLSSSSGGKADTSNAGLGVKSSVSNSSQFTSTSIFTLVLSLIASLILIASVIAITTYVIKSSDLRRRIRRAKAALDSSRNSSASGSSSAASFGSSHCSFNFPRINPARGHREPVKPGLGLGVTSTLGSRIGTARHPVLQAAQANASARANGHAGLLALEATSTSHRTKDLSPLVISSVNTSIDTTGTSSNNSSCSSNGGHGNQPASSLGHAYHRATGSLYRASPGGFYSAVTSGGRLSPPTFGLAQVNSRTDGEGFLPSEKEFDYRSFIVTPSFTCSSRTSSRTSSKSAVNGHGYGPCKSKVKNITRAKHKADQASQLELLIQQSNGPLVQPSSTFRSSRIMTLGHPDRHRGQVSPPELGPMVAPRSLEPKNSECSEGAYAAFNLYEDIADLGAICSSGEERAIGQVSALNHQLVSHYAYNSCNDSHNLENENDPNDDSGVRNDEGNVISVNESMLEGPLGVNLHQAKSSSHYIGRRNVF